MRENLEHPSPEYYFAHHRIREQIAYDKVTVIFAMESYDSAVGQTCPERLLLW